MCIRDRKNASSMIHPRGYPGFILKDDGRFVVSGGFSEPRSPDRSDAEIYDPVSNVWTEMGDLLFPRHGHGMVEVPGDILLIAGGSNCETGGCHSNLEVFDLSVDEWKDSGHLIMGRKWCSVDLIGGDTVVVAGGRACNYPTADTELLVFEKESGSVKSSYAEVDPVSVLFLIFTVMLISSVLFLYFVKERT
jgi:hypothetical protein